MQLWGATSASMIGPGRWRLRRGTIGESPGSGLSEAQAAPISFYHVRQTVPWTLYRAGSTPTALPPQIPSLPTFHCVSALYLFHWDCCCCSLTSVFFLPLPSLHASTELMCIEASDISAKPRLLSRGGHKNVNKILFH